MLPTFSSQVLGPVFESMARYWTQLFADPEVIGGDPAHVGTTLVHPQAGGERQIDVLVAFDDGDTPSGRTILALGEAKSGERIGTGHLSRLDEAKATMGERASSAKLLLFGVDFSPDVRTVAELRRDVELVGLERLYGEPS